MGKVRYPSLYQINTRVWLTELSRGLGRAATLDDIPDDTPPGGRGGRVSNFAPEERNKRRETEPGPWPPRSAGAS